MSRARETLDGGYFEALYARERDPWRFETSAYEAAKYDATLAALGEDRVGRALEVGCSIGVLTRRLAARCERLVATDIAPRALEEARRRCADLANVEFRLSGGPTDGLGEAWDLIVLSEVAYYWDDGDLARVAAGLREALRPGGRLLLVHWTGETNYPKTADEAVEALASGAGPWIVERRDREPQYRLDLWRRAGGAA